MKYIQKTILGILLCSAALAADRQHNFYHISVDNGLSHQSANDCYIDDIGLVWIATADGLNCFDGNRVQVYRHPSQGSNLITKIVSDGKGLLYLLRSDGVSSFDCRTLTMQPIINDHVGAICYHNGLLLGIADTLLRYNPEDHSTSPILQTGPNSTITSIAADGDSLYIGTKNNGLFCFCKGKEKYHLLSPCRITHIEKSGKGSLLVCTWNNGLFEIKDGQISNNYTVESGLLSNFVRSCCESGDSGIWIGTISGLDCIEADGIRHYRAEQDNQFGLTDNSIWSLTRDRQGNIWISTYYGGVNFFNPAYEPFKRIGSAGVEGDGLSNPVVGQMVEDSKGNLWIATESGLNYLDRQRQKTEWHCREIEHIKALCLEESLNRIWIASDMGGLFLYDYAAKTKRSFRHKSDDPSTIPNDRVTDIIPYNKDSLLISTHSGLFILSSLSGKGRRYDEALPAGLGSEVVADIMQDEHNNLWIATTEKGLYKYNPKSGIRSHYELGFSSARNINSLKQDSEGNIWLCTSDCGLFLYQQATDSFHNYNAADCGFSTNRIYCVDRLPKSGRLILSTGTGFTIFNPADGTSSNYGVKNGLPFNSAYEKALLVTKDETVFIGSTRGMVSFDENGLKANPAHAKVTLAALTANGEDIRPGDKSGLLPQAAQYIGELSFGPGISQFALTFAVTDHTMSDEIELEYKLAGLSDRWTALPDNRQINFTKLNPGKYKLTVRASNKSESECQKANLKIIVRPPWYRTSLAYILWVLTGIGIFCFALRTYKGRLRLAESLKYEKRRNADIEEMNRSKLNFYAAVSQEITTPLTIIISQAESIMQKQVFIPEAWKKMLSVYKNSLRLKDLSDEMREFRKQAAGEMKIHVTPHNLASFAGEFVQLFEEYAKTRGISLRYEKGTDTLEVWYDEKQIQTVLSTLLANSFKHTKAGDSITVKLSCEGSYAILEVIDSGYGIPEKELEDISGTGLGYAVAKGIIETHHGSIHASSSPDQGARFKLRLPLGYSHFTQDQLSEGEEIQQGGAENEIYDEDYFTEPFNNRLRLSKCEKLRKPSDTAAGFEEKDILKRAGKIVEEHIADCEFSVESFATAMGMSRTALFSRIKETSGSTPNDFILSVRLKRAAFLLKNYPNISVSQVSEETGFGSARYFSQKFRNVYGMTPLAYRKKG